jgi:2-succinyl-5-enolpyruvyl-6-hydroxy-3-cyclohexene-1-carboxylate synthase
MADAPDTPANVNVLWAATLVDELVDGGLSAVCVSPGSRSTPLTVACYEHPELRVFSHLDEHSSAFFALGRARRTGEPTALVCTSGTAAAHYHPAIVEASQARVPLLALTADRPPELRDSGANQTVDQEKLYGDSVRWYRDLPEPEATPRTVRRLRTDAARALAAATGTPAGPVHVNVPFRKPLEPTRVEPDAPDGVPADWHDGDDRAREGRDGAYVTTHAGSVTSDEGVSSVAAALAAADRPLFVAGPADPASPVPDAFASLADRLDAPLLADPLSGLRYGTETAEVALGGYDAFLDGRATGDWPAPDVVLRVGASPTSKPLRRYLARGDASEFLVDPAGEWRDAEFVASDLVVADPTPLVDGVREALDGAAGAVDGWASRWHEAEAAHWRHHDAADEWWEGRVVGAAVDAAPDPATVFVSNSMPVRDVDRYARPRDADLTVLANRGASGIDGVVSSALGAGSATDDPLVLVTGDLAYYHDSNGLLALDRCDVDATVVLVNNDGGGIFHLLPIADFDPPFTEGFRTPHGLDFAPTGDLYDLEFARVPPERFAETYCESLATPGTQVVEVGFDAAASHATREERQSALRDELS